MFKLISFRSDGAFWPLAERSDFEAAARSSSLLARVLAAPRLIAAAIAREMAARRAMRALANLDDRMLHDIGIHRDQVRHAARHGASDMRSEMSRWW